VPLAKDWRRVITAEDSKRLRQWRQAFLTALADAALEPVDLRPGNYRCRVVKLGTVQPSMPSYTPYPSVDCTVRDDGGAITLSKMDGPQRPIGVLFDDGPLRRIFLGTMMLSDETRPLNYGRGTARDLVGVVERIDARRWRLVLPYPRFESILDVIELTPAG
jgi:Domain of unknown function (DUF4893)